MIHPIALNSERLSVALTKVNKIIRNLSREVLDARNQRRRIETMESVSDEVKEEMINGAIYESSIGKKAKTPYSPKVQLLIDALQTKADEEILIQCEHDLAVEIYNTVCIVNAESKIVDQPDLADQE